MNKEKTIKIVRDAYGKIAQGQKGCCGGTCGPDAREFAKSIGYSEKELKVIPDEANLALSCGNPTALAGLKKGETVLDLGSGAGFDCFLSASKVGPKGKVIGVDMTPEMVSKARANAAKTEFRNVEFRLGEIEHLPVADSSIDVIISNCVINLSPEKQKVFDETFRVLSPGGRLAVSDVVATAELPDDVKSGLALYAGCIAGASLIDEVGAMLRKSGFVNIRITPKHESKEFIRTWVPGRNVEDFVMSATIEAVKP